jgi:hypothetical protein
MNRLDISIFLIAILLTGTVATAQYSLELEKRNGFKDIKLGSLVDSIKGASYVNAITSKEGQVSKIYRVKNPAYQSIGEVPVEELELTAYKGLIYIIKVIAEKDTRLMKGMEMALGKSEWDLRNEQYVWKGQSLTLTFKSTDKDKLELTYTSYPVLQKMKEDKKKEIEDIAGDF